MFQWFIRRIWRKCLLSQQGMSFDLLSQQGMSFAFGCQLLNKKSFADILKLSLRQTVLIQTCNGYKLCVEYYYRNKKLKKEQRILVLRIDSSAKIDTLKNFLGTNVLIIF